MFESKVENKISKKLGHLNAFLERLNQFRAGEYEINLKRVGQLRNTSLVTKQWLVYSELAVILLGIGGPGFCGAVSVRDLNMSGLFLSLITLFLLHGLCMAGTALSKRAKPNHTPGRPQQEISLPPPPSAWSFLTFCHGNIKVSKVVVSQENKYCPLRSYTCKLSL